MIKSFRGLIADGGQDRIRLSTIQGKVGYKITRFEVFPARPGHGADTESTVLIWKVKQTSVSTTTHTVDFTNANLLGAAYLNEATGATQPASPIVTIFDLETFNQDIYVTHTEGANSESINYYIELEVMALSNEGAEYTTIKDIRSNS
jgi:hypothetical protein